MNAATALFYFTLVLSLIFVARVGFAVFSREGRKKLKEQWLLNTVLFLAFGLFCLMYLPLLTHYYFPPTWWERQVQRKEVLARVQSVGGWDALRKDCVLLAKQCQGEVSQWDDRHTNGLPAAIIALKPRRVEFYPPKQRPHFNNSDFPIVRITIFGAHSTGGRGIPWLGLDVVCAARSGTNYQTHRQRSETPLRYWRYRKVVDDVYEFF